MIIKRNYQGGQTCRVKVMGSEKRVRLGHRGVTFILSIFEVHLEVIGTKVGGRRIARSFGSNVFLSISPSVRGSLRYQAPFWCSLGEVIGVPTVYMLINTCEQNHRLDLFHLWVNFDIFKI